MLMDCCKLQDKNVHFYSNIYNRAINSSFLRIIFQKIYLQLMKVLSENRLQIRKISGLFTKEKIWQLDFLSVF